MKYARMAFTKELMLHSGGLSKSLFEQMLAFLPPDYKILGFGEDYNRFLCFVFIGSDKFVDTPETMMPPEIMAYFKRDYDAKTGKTKDYCDKIDFGNALATQATCIHVWDTYVGIMDSFRYCTKCNKKDTP